MVHVAAIFFRSVFLRPSFSACCRWTTGENDARFGKREVKEKEKETRGSSTQVLVNLCLCEFKLMSVENAPPPGGMTHYN